MLKKLSAIILLLSFSLQVFSSQFVALDYYLNTSAYAKNCINKAKPTLHCNGKCQFMKKVQQHEKKEQESSEGKSAGKNETNLSSKSFFSTIALKDFLPQKKSYPVQQDRNTIDISLPVFHPPGI